MPVLPLVASTIVVLPGSMRPSRSAASIIATPMRSLTLPPGLNDSSLPNSSIPSGASRRSSTIGVRPTCSAMLSGGSPTPEFLSVYERILAMPDIESAELRLMAAAIDADLQPRVRLDADLSAEGAQRLHDMLTAVAGDVLPQAGIETVWPLYRLLDALESAAPVPPPG